MNLFEVKVSIRVVSPSESEVGKFLVLVDEDGNFPEFTLSSSSNIESQVYDFMNSIFYGSDLDLILSTKTISSIVNNENSVHVLYNFITYSTSSKLGSFVLFNKQSLELCKIKRL